MRQPAYGEDELRSAAFHAKVAVRINGRARAEREPFIELYARLPDTAPEHRPLLGVFRFASEAVAFLNGDQHG